VVRDDLVQGLLETADAGGWTALISSHDIDEVERLADRIAMLDAGRLRIEEATESLLARFRRIEVDLQGRPANLDALPAAWTRLEQAGDRIRLVDTRYTPGPTEALCRRHFPEATITAFPMTLREIFVALARTKIPATTEALR
jgi:ABC-2 type transport system ATP-binding protein